MLKERKKNILDDFFPVVNGYSKGENVPQQPVPKAVEQADHLDLEFAGREGCFSGSGSRKR